ncbi:hypothetical protein ACROYT_G015931 [Oculina patagonica]
MANLMSHLCVSECLEDSELNDLVEEDDDVVLFSAVSCFMRRNLTRIQDYSEVTIPRYLPDEFKSHFRMTRETCELLVREIVRTGDIPLGNPSGREVIAPQKQVLVFLWRIANQEPARAVADRFDITVSSVNRVFRRVVNATVSLSGQYIRWPNGNEANEIKTSFEDDGGFPGIIGLIDGTHIRIRAPEHEPEAYINRKKYHSMNVQLVCDNNMVFTDVLAGWPGSVHDSRVLRNSGLWHTSANKFLGDTHLLGDGGYPLLRWLITPYRDNGHLTARQQRFNRILSSIRQTVERAIALLKGRWRRLLFLDHLDLELEVKIIIAACVLHNFCLVHDDFDAGYMLDGNDDNDRDDNQVPCPDGRAEQKRTHLMNVVCGP